MHVYTFIICTLFASVLDYKMVNGRTTYDSSSYNSDRDENLVNHQKKRLANDESMHEEPSVEFERGFDTNRYRKFDPDAGYVRRDRIEESKMQKRDFYDPSSSGKDASIEVILDPRAKKAVAVVENSPSGQAMYDLSGWKNKEEPSYESDQFAPGTQQEQVVNLVYPAERTERKYATEFGSDYSDKSKVGKVMVTGEREDTHKRKRNADVKKDSSDKRSIQDKSKRKSELKTDSKECPPHNNPSTSESETKDSTNLNTNEKEIKRDASQWSSEQLSALRNSLNNVQDTNGEVQNLRSILSSMGLLEDTIDKKREVESKVTEKREDSDLKEDEDLNQDNLSLKRNNREARTEDENAAPEEAIEKREAEDESNYEEDMNEEFEEKSNVKRSSDSENEEAKDELNKDRNKRQDQKLSTDSEKAKRETGDSAKETRKNRADETEEEYERRMENQIQAKIDAIKEKVKREIMEEQYKRRFKRNNQENIPVNRKRRQAKDDAKANEIIVNPSETQKGVRRKRSEKQMVYQGFQGADADEEAEDNEFDDNAFDGRMYNVEKRQAEDESEYYDPVRKRDEETYMRQYYPESRSRRSYAEDSNAFHGSRRALKNKGFIENQEFNSKSNDENEKVDSEYFGSLPQVYNGELTRYKRVKRDDPYK